MLDLIKTYCPYAVGAGSVIAAVAAYIKLSQEIEALRLQKKKLLLEIKKLEAENGKEASEPSPIAVATFEEVLAIAEGHATWIALRETVAPGQLGKRIRSIILRSNGGAGFTDREDEWIQQKVDAVFGFQSVWLFFALGFPMAYLTPPDERTWLLPLLVILFVPLTWIVLRRNIEVFRYYCTQHLPLFHPAAAKKLAKVFGSET